MAVSNLPNLSVAAPSSTGKISPQSISGGQTLGSGVVESAANNITGFKRAGTSAVSPKVPNIAALLQSISSSIISNVENITSGVKNVIQGGITNVTNVFGRKESEEDPNKIMSEFLGLYQKALDYIKFFADPKQIQGFDKAIQLYQDSLKSTGDTVVTIRKFIKKMIKDFLKLKNELANMGGGGGFRLPRLPLPGRQPRQPRGPARRPRTRMPRGRGGKLGLGLLGLGLLGSGAMAANKFIGGNEEKQQTSEGISGELITKFDGVLEKFDQAIATLENLTASAAGGGDGKPKKVKDGGPRGDDLLPMTSDFDASKIKDAFNTGLVTGPKGRIGRGTEYHIDSQFSSDLPMEDIVKMVDQMALAYDAMGREMEFSNAAVADKIYNPNASLEEKSALLMDVFKAHNLPRGRKLDGKHGFYQMDYFVPFKGKGRGHESAESAPLLLPFLQDGSVRYEKSGSYGASADLIDSEGKVRARVGHGDVRGAKSGTIDLSTVRPFSQQVQPVEEVKPDPKAQEVSRADPQSTSFIQQVPGSNSVAVIPASDSSQPQTQTQPPPALVASSVENINFNLTVENPDNFFPLSAKQMLNIVG
tara:strand:+ start:2678 stop:4447 length:1770 start_codon:yes stop_codon:yes gene_type:complete